MTVILISRSELKVALRTFFFLLSSYKSRSTHATQHMGTKRPREDRSSPEGVELGVGSHLVQKDLCSLRGANKDTRVPLLSGNLQVLHTGPLSRVSTRDPMLTHLHNTWQLTEISHVDPVNRIVLDSARSCRHARIRSMSPAISAMIAGVGVLSMNKRDIRVSQRRSAWNRGCLIIEGIVSVDRDRKSVV